MVADVAASTGQPQALRTRAVSILDLSSSDAAAWRDLASRSVEPNPFYEVDFMVPVCRHLREGKNVALMVAEDTGRFHACLPVRRTTLLGGLSLPVISSWRHRYGFLGTPLVAPERGVEAVRSILAGMGGSGEGARIVVFELFGDNGPVGSYLRRAAEELGLTVYVYSSGERAVFSCQDDEPDALSPSIKRERRAKTRQWRRLCADWGMPAVVDRAHSRNGSADFLAMEASGWKGRARTALASRASDAAFYREVTDRFRASGKLRLYALEVGGKTLAMQTNLCARSALFDWKVAYDEDFARYGPGVQLQLRVLEQACQEGLSWIDSCSEVTDDHQLRLSPARRRIATLAVGRDGGAARWELRFGVLLVKVRRRLAGLSVSTARHALSGAFRDITRRLR